MPLREENSMVSHTPEERKYFDKVRVIAENPPENYDVASSSHTQGRTVAMPETT